MFVCFVCLKEIYKNKNTKQINMNEEYSCYSPNNSNQIIQINQISKNQISKNQTKIKQT